MADSSSSKSKYRIELSSYASSLPSEAKNRYEAKLLYNRGTQSLPDPYVISEKWDPNPSTWPDLTFGDIYLYLVDTPSIYTKESMKAYKSLEAYSYVVSGHVHEVLSHQIDDSCPFMALKTKVTPSQRARDKPHQPWVYLDKADGTVYCAHCTCMAGLGEVCSHIAALLFKVEMAVKMGLTEKSSTSKACQWNNTFRKEVVPTTVTDIFQQIKGKRTKEIETTQANGSSTLPSQDVLDELYALVPNAAFFTSIKVNDCPPVKPSDDKYPKLLSSYQTADYNPDDLSTLVTQMFTSYSVTPDQATKLEQATRNQSISSLWYQHRMGRITGSKAHDVLTIKPTTSPDNLVRRIVGYNMYDLSKKAAVKWGLDHEEECRSVYMQHQVQNHQNFVCNLSGLVINPEHPFLGASPDGMIKCICCGQGTLEVKCPYKHRDITVQEAALNDRDFCLNRDMTLKKTHRYYTQIQMQMLVTNTQYTDFVVYTKCKPTCSMVIVRVGIDLDFLNTLLQKCNTFIKDNLLQEIITRRLEHEPITRQREESTGTSQETTWCICNEAEYGRMIRCDGDDCPYQWFHYRCVNIRRKPRGKWYCHSCEQ